MSTTENTVPRMKKAHIAMADFIQSTNDADAREIAKAELEELFLNGCLPGVVQPERIAYILDRWETR